MGRVAVDPPHVRHDVGPCRNVCKLVHSFSVSVCNLVHSFCVSVCKLVHVFCLRVCKLVNSFSVSHLPEYDTRQPHHPHDKSGQYG